jgi:hypothetical protein
MGLIHGINASRSLIAFVGAIITRLAMLANFGHLRIGSPSISASLPYRNTSLLQVVTGIRRFTQANRIDIYGQINLGEIESAG